MCDSTLPYLHVHLQSWRISAEASNMSKEVILLGNSITTLLDIIGLLAAAAAPYATANCAPLCCYVHIKNPALNCRFEIGPNSWSGRFDSQSSWSFSVATKFNEGTHYSVSASSHESFFVRAFKYEKTQLKSCLESDGQRTFNDAPSLIKLVGYRIFNLGR